MSNNEKKIFLGIKIGTLNTVYSLCYSLNGKFIIEVLLSDVASRTIPSQICYSDTNRLYGETSNSKMKKFYNSSYLDISRLIGFFLNGKDSIYQKEFKYIESETFDHSTNKFKTYNNDYCDSSIIIADYLSLINKYFFEENGLKYDYTTFSVPDYYTYYQKNILKTIAEAIGMKNVNIIYESSAITMYYGYNKYYDMFKTKKNPKDVKHIIFVDIGHSKTSFIYSTFTYHSFKVEYVKSSYHFGGRNIDKRIYNLCIEDFKASNSISDKDEKFASFIKRNKKNILDAVIKARKVLTVNEETSVLIENFYNNNDLKYDLTRNSFELLIQDYTNYVTKEFLEFLKVIPKDIINQVKIEMAGELMRIPKFQEIIKSCHKNFSISKRILIDECSSVGAGLYTLYYQNKNEFPITELKEFIPYEPKIMCYLDIGGNVEQFLFQNHNSIEMCNYLKNIDNIINVKEIRLNFAYEQNYFNLYPSRYENIYSYRININKLKQENKNLNNMKDIELIFTKENDEIKIDVYMIDNNETKIRCEYSNGYELDDSGIINNEWNNIKNEISNKISEHKEIDEKYHYFENRKNGLIRLINKYKGKELSEEEVKKWKNSIKILSEDITKKIDDKITDLEKYKNEIENIIKNKFKEEEIKFEGEKQSLIERIKLAREMNKNDIKTRNEIVKNSGIFEEYSDNIRTSMIILGTEKKESSNSLINEEIDVSKSSLIDLSKLRKKYEITNNPLSKKGSNSSIQSHIELEKVVEKDEGEDNQFFKEMIQDIKNIPISKREKLKEYETDWAKKIEAKKFESNKNDVLKLIEVFMDLEDYKNALATIKKELENNQITPYDAKIKVLALKKISEYEKNLFDSK